MKKKLWAVVVMMFCSIFLTLCSDTSTTEAGGDFELLSTSSLGCIEDQPLEKIANDGTLQWLYDEGVLKLFVDINTHCGAQFENTVDFSGDAITIMLEDVAENVARCTCYNREEFNIKVSGTTEVRVICKVKYHGSNTFEKVIDRTLRLFF